MFQLCLGMSTEAFKSFHKFAKAFCALLRDVRLGWGGKPEGSRRPEGSFCSPFAFSNGALIRHVRLEQGLLQTAEGLTGGVRILD